MTSTNAWGFLPASHRSFSRHRLISGLIMSVFVAVAFIASRWLWGPRSAEAQAPRTAAAAKGTAPMGTARTPASTPRTPSGKAPAVKSGASASDSTPAQSLAVMAVVNGEQITRDRLANECLRRFGKDVLESIVNKHLIWQACQTQGITITEKDVEDEITRNAGKFGLSAERWLTMLRDEREISPDQYRREIIWPNLALRQLAASQIEVTQAELREAFETDYGPQVKVRLIAVSSQDKAEQIHKEVTAKPERFGDIAKEKSEDPNSAAGRGQIPPIRKHVGDPQVENVAFSLQESQISPIIHVANQYLILKCEKHVPESYVSSSQVKQIEGQLHDKIRDNKLRVAAAELFRKMQTEAQVVVVLNDPKLSTQMPGVAATINKGQVTMKQLADECLLRHGKDVLEGEINRQLLEQELQRRGKAIGRADIDTEIARAADSYGFIKPDRSPDVEAWLKAVTEAEHVSVELYVTDSVWPSVALKTIVGDTIEVTQEDLDKGFESNYGPRVEVQAIVLSDQRQANKVWDMARNNPTDQFFGELAQQYSAESISRSNLGKVPPIRRFGGQPVIEEEAFRLKPGELSGIIAVGDKFVILRCQGRTKPMVTNFADVADELRKDIHEKKLRLAMAQEFDRIRESAQIDNFLAGTTQAGKRLAARPANPSRPPAANPSAGPSAASQSSRNVAPAKYAPPSKAAKR